MLAIVIFGIAATAIMSGFLTAMKSTRSDRSRVQASDLAARELEITRNEFYASSSGPTNLAANDYVVDGHPLPGGTAGQPLVVDNTPYTVIRNVEPLIAGSGVSPCDGGSSVQYPEYQVTVTVSWSNMAGVKPVTSSTLLTPPKGSISNTYGYVAVKVLNSSGAPNSGRTVSISGPGGSDSDVTGSDGCAVFAEATAGTYTVSLGETGFVDYYGSPTPSKTATVSSGTLQQVQFSYDQKAKLNVSLGTDAGYNLPSSYATTSPTVVIANTGLQPSGTKAVVLTSSSSGSIDNLWPFTDGYTAWVGSCGQSDPAASGGSRGAATVIAPGSTGSVSIRLAPVKVTVANGSGVVQPNLTIVASPASATGCLTTENPLTLGVTDSTGTLMTSLPAGAWTLQVSGKTSASGSWPSTGALQPTSAATTVPLVVN